MGRSTCGLFSLILCLAPFSGAVASEPAIPVDGARQVFAQARALCARDGGKLWGASLCAPIMLVDPQSRQIVAAQADAKGVLQARDGVYVGVLPADQNVANTAFEWSGTRWTQMLWPLPENDGERATLIAHELFHQLQPRLPIAKMSGGENPHLDTLEGRYTLQLEWRALALALESEDAAARNAAVRDAIAFRAQRYRLFPAAERDETALEFNEGLAEYTGVMVGNASADARRQGALRDLSLHVDNVSFVRSFAYATGPAYGLLLDQAAPDWRQRLGEGKNLAWMLRDAARIEIPVDDASLATAAARYQGAALRASETRREEQRQAQLQRNRQRFVDGPVLTLKFEHMKVQFNPSNLQPLDDLGTVYPNLRIVDDWGTLEVEGGALMKSDWSAVIVSAPATSTGSPLKGEGWILELKPEWRLGPGARKGDLILDKPAQQPASK